ncbi:MAG: DMT family transporter [Kiritimatiellae bacterium]|nr:DMT family transporter [Kiritimatiellia bacterium]
MFANLKYNLLMMLAALIWGSAFVAQRVGMDFNGPYTFNCVRSFIGSLALLPVILTLGRAGAARQFATRGGRRNLIVGGLVCGAILTASTLFQQIGLTGTSAGKAGFITAQYILLVPLFGLFLGKRTTWLLWLAVAIALAGMYLLCVKDGLRVEKSDLCVLCCAVGFAFHILVIDHFAQRVDGILLSCVQFIVCGVLSGVLMFVLEKPNAGNLLKGWVPLLYTGILSSGVAYTLQIITQQHLSPAVAALVMSLESVFAALTGWIVLHERLTPREFIGCVLVFAATLLAQAPSSSAQKAS